MINLHSSFFFFFAINNLTTLNYKFKQELTVVDKNTNVVSQQLGEIKLVRVLKVVDQVLVDIRVASSPRNSADAELVDDGRLSQVRNNVVKVVAQRTIALLADVVHVNVTGSGETNLEDFITIVEGITVVTSFNVLLALSVGLIHLANGALADQTIGVQVRSIRLVLDDGINQTVTDSNGYKENTRLEGKS